VDTQDRWSAPKRLHNGGEDGRALRRTDVATSISQRCSYLSASLRTQSAYDLLEDELRGFALALILLLFEVDSGTNQG
jgi:hypothetical protein